MSRWICSRDRGRIFVLMLAVAAGSGLAQAPGTGNDVLAGLSAYGQRAVMHERNYLPLTSLGLLAQDAVPRGPQLHSRQGPPPQAPNEQLLPPSSVAPFVVPNPKKYPQKYAAVYMPVSLAVGRVRTPEFPVAKTQWYDIMLQVEKPLPFLRMRCMTGTTSGPLDAKDCEKVDPIVRADWTVWEDGRIVQWGSIPDNNCGCKFTDKNIFKQIGSFPLEASKKYVVQVHFTKDGSPLNVANPHLIVIPHQDMW